MRTAIVVTIALPPVLERVRARETDDARLGIPAHITLLSPFVPLVELDDGVRETVRTIVDRQLAFEVELTEVRRFGPSAGSPAGVLWLVPVPDEPFVALTRSLVAAFPGLEPYGGAHDEVVPHLTIATADARRFDHLEAEALRHLPVAQVITHAALLLESPDGQWRTAERFGLG